MGFGTQPFPHAQLPILCYQPKTAWNQATVPLRGLRITDC